MIGTIKFCRKPLLILIKAFEFKDPKLNIEPKPFDTAFWITEGFNENDFYDIARSCDNDDIIEHVQLVDQFTHPKTGKVNISGQFKGRLLNSDKSRDHNELWNLDNLILSLKFLHLFSDVSLLPDILSRFIKRNIIQRCGTYRCSNSKCIG